MEKQKFVDAFFTKEAFNEYAKRLKEENAKAVGLTVEQWDAAVLSGSLVYQQPFKIVENNEYCQHTSCQSCRGTGYNLNTGAICVHYLSCSCSKCSPRY